MLTNNYETPDCPGTISVLHFLVLNKIEVVYYASTTFLHTKFIIIDGKRASVSSINFSQASFVRNREAGAIIEGTNAGPFMAFLQSVYEDDWARGIPLQPNATQWNHTQLATILNTSKIDVVLPTPGSTWKEYYVTPVPKPITASARFMLATAPDYAMQTLSTFLGEATKTLDVMVYQITEQEVVDQIVALAKRGVAVRLLVSSSIFGADDCASANAMYAQLTAAGHAILKTTRHYTYSHQKFAIVDGNSVGWSTGNLSPSDLPPNEQQADYPPYGNSGWVKSNRDFSFYIRGSSAFAAPFQAVFDHDSDRNGTFPSKVYPWETAYQVVTRLLLSCAPPMSAGHSHVYTHPALRHAFVDLF